MKFGSGTGPEIPPPHLPGCSLKKSLLNIFHVLLLCPKPETKKDWLEIQRSKPSGGLLSPREHDIPRVIRRTHEPYEISEMQKRQFHMVQLRANISRYWKSVTALCAMGERDEAFIRTVCWVWRNLASCWASLASLSIQTFGLGGRHIGQTLVQTLAEIPTLAFLVTGRSAARGERGECCPSTVHCSSVLNALPRILGAEAGRKSERRELGTSTLFFTTLPPSLVADKSKITHLKPHLAQGHMTW